MNTTTDTVNRRLKTALLVFLALSTPAVLTGYALACQLFYEIAQPAIGDIAGFIVAWGAVIGVGGAIRIVVEREF